MGDYADMAIERDFNNYIDSIDRNDYDDPFDGPHTVIINKKSEGTQLPIKLFPVVIILKINITYNNKRN